MKGNLNTIRLCCTGAALAALLSGCKPTTECGSWNFTGTPGADNFGVISAFTFTPQNCGSSCSCTTTCIIQMAWVYDFTDGMYVYPTSAYADRATPNGWSVDQDDGWAYGYYGLNNDGKTFDNDFNPPGSNNQPTTLYDDPGGQPNNTWFYALDVAVCFTSPSCQNSILGYYFWSWTIDENGKTAQFIVGPAWKGLDTQFQQAVSDWNTWAPTSGSENEGISGQPTLPHAVPLPSMSDL